MEQNFLSKDKYFMLDVTKKSGEQEKDTKRDDIAKIILLEMNRNLDGYKQEKVAILKSNETVVQKGSLMGVDRNMDRNFSCLDRKGTYYYKNIET